MLFNSKRLLINIDKNLSLISQAFEFMKKDFEEHKYSDSKRKEKAEEWENMIVEKIRICPESEHIKLQNGKIGYISDLSMSTANTVNEIKITASTKEDIRKVMLKILGVGISLFLALLAALKYFSN